MSSTAYPQALQYFEKGIMVLDSAEWDNQYDFLSELTVSAAEAAYLSGEYEKVDRHVQSMIQHSRALMDSVKGAGDRNKKIDCPKQIDRSSKTWITNFE